MAKLKTDEILPEDLVEYLNSYSDFSFELAVLKMLRTSDIDCEHGGYYEDPITKKSREFDIRAIKTIQNGFPDHQVPGQAIDPFNDNRVDAMAILLQLDHHVSQTLSSAIKMGF
jgi:hypothetical protein